MIIAEVTLAFVIVQSCVFFYQAILYRRQAKSLENTIVAMREVAQHQSEDMRNSILAAQSAAEAGVESANLARITLEVSERAWLNVDVMVKLPIRGEHDGMQMDVKYIIRNVGKTPAINVKASIEIINTTKTMPKSGQIKHVDGIPSDEASFGDVIWPGGLLEKVWTYAIGADVVEDLRKADPAFPFPNIGPFPAAAVGTVRYETVFGGRKESGFIRDMGLLVLDSPVRLLPSRTLQADADGFVLLPRMLFEGRVT